MAVRAAYTIYANDQLLEAKDWNDVIIAYRNGGPLRVRDIGTAVAGPEDAKQAAWANGKRGVFLVIFKQPGANVIDTVDKIKARLPRLIASIPPTIKVTIMQRPHPDHPRGGHGRADSRCCSRSLLVVLVIFIFLRSVWATIIPSVTVPLALLGACALMWMFGYTPRQPVADGADDFGRVRRRRRDRRAGKHHAICRGRRETIRTRRSRAPARSVSRSCRSASRWSPC